MASAGLLEAINKDDKPASNGGNTGFDDKGGDLGVGISADCLKLGFSYLSGAALCRTSGVCRHWGAISGNLWRRACERDYPVLLQIQEMAASISWKALYAKRFIADWGAKPSSRNCFPEELAGFRFAVEIVDRVTREPLTSKLLPFGWCDVDDGNGETCMLTEGMRNRFHEPVAGPRPKVEVKKKKFCYGPNDSYVEVEQCFWELTAFVVRLEDSAIWMIGSGEAVKLPNQDTGYDGHLEHFRDNPYCEPDNWADHELVANLWDHELYTDEQVGIRECKLHVYVELDPPDLSDLLRHEKDQDQYLTYHSYDKAKSWKEYKGQEQGGYPGYAAIVSISAHLCIDGDSWDAHGRLNSRSEFISMVTSGTPFN